MKKFTFITMGELMKQGKEYEKKIYSTGIDGVKVSKDHITLDGHYEITFERIPTELALLKWIAHLSEKDWFTRKQLYWLIQSASRKNNLDIYGV